MALDVELVTVGPCEGSECEACAEAQRAMLGVARDLGLVLVIGDDLHGGHPAREGSLTVIVRLRHLSCEEAPLVPLAMQAPLLRIDGRVVLKGRRWRKAEMEAALREALALAPGLASVSR